MPYLYTFKVSPKKIYYAKIFLLKFCATTLQFYDVIFKKEQRR